MLHAWCGSSLASCPPVVAESAGNHMLCAIIRALRHLHWRPSKVVSSAFCMPPQMLIELQGGADESWLFLVHSLDRLCPMLPQDRKPEWQWLQANGATVVDMDLHMKRLNQLAFGRSCHNLLEPLWSSFEFRTWLAGLPGKCMIKPLIDATGPAMCMTFIFASLWLTDVDERRLGRSSIRFRHAGRGQDHGRAPAEFEVGYDFVEQPGTADGAIDAVVVGTLLRPRCPCLSFSDSNKLALRARLQLCVVEIPSRASFLECQELLHSHVRWRMGEMDGSVFGIPWQGAW